MALHCVISNTHYYLMAALTLTIVYILKRDENFLLAKDFMLKKVFQYLPDKMVNNDRNTIEIRSNHGIPSFKCEISVGQQQDGHDFSPR